MIQSPGVLLYVVGFLLLLGPLVVIHELGHYIVARWFGVKAESFSIGFGKELAGWTDKRGTRWKLSLLPLGGYVQFAGDMNPASQPDAAWLSLPAEEREGCFQGKPLWQRSLIVLAGPAANLIFAIAILAAFLMAYGQVVATPVVGIVEPGSVAASAGLRSGDRITAIKGEAIDRFGDITRIVAPRPGQSLDMTVERGGRTLGISATVGRKVDKDQFGNEFTRGYLGIGPAQADVRPVGPLRAVVLATGETRDMIGMMVTGIAQIVTGQRSTEELGGPLKIAKYSGEQLSLGWRAFVAFAAFISINLGFINLLPIPVLDGGHLAFYAAEAVRRKPASQRSQEWAFRTGVAFVVVLMLFVTFNDLASLRLFGG
ncbi:RIP metalloprotease RseP [Novosphingobium tardum]|uniref:Zinc metalloprotease n=1 Tax=Novosphingobium tardum TaxID=1538021 RepID=A0ABV8RQC0_9SPHN